MSRTMRWIGILAVTSLLTVAGAGLAANAEQSGSGTTCADFNVLWLTPRASVANATNRSVVEVDANTGFEVQSDQGIVHVDFYNDAGEWVGYNDGNETGVVPDGATWGTICVGQVTGFWPDAPNPTAEWTYQDGFSTS